jgi:nicotinamidase-related amidase
MHPIPLSLDDFLKPERVALVMWDMQKGLAGKAPDSKAIVENARNLVAQADRLKIPVIWSRHIAPPFDMTAGPFMLWLMLKQKVDHPSKVKPAMQRGMEETEYVDGFGPADHHVIIEKSQPSFFVDTPLAARLKAMDRDTIVIGGVATDIGVEFTCRHAAALGIYAVVAEDACGAYTQAAQDRSMAFLKGWTTPVEKTDTICAHWQKY